MLVWQAVKGEYREFISGGFQDQSIRVTQSEALGKFVELGTTALNENQTLDDPVISATYRRAGYLEYFSAAVTKVPAEIPHQKGALLSESLSFALIPRILNPNKGVKSDREKVERFTDYYFGGERNISSFSLGHYCEAYIDWGPNGMMVHLFIYGSTRRLADGHHHEQNTQTQSHSCLRNSVGCLDTLGHLPTRHDHHLRKSGLGLHLPPPHILPSLQVGQSVHSILSRSLKCSSTALSFCFFCRLSLGCIGLSPNATSRRRTSCCSLRRMSSTGGGTGASSG